MSEKVNARDEHMKRFTSRKIVKSIIERPVKNFFKTTTRLRNQDNVS